VLITVDVGPAGAVSGHAHERDGDWARAARGVEVLRDALKAHEDELGSALPATWFVRADAIVARQLGDRCALVRGLAPVLDPLRAAGHEHGWMPQIYSGLDAGVDHADLAATHAALAGAGFAPASVRMGGCFHDDDSMAALEALGVRHDCSALPGRHKTDGGWRADWRGTPATPYRPSRADYRVPGTPARALLELPLSMVAIAAPYDAAPLARYVDLAYHPPLLADAMAGLAARDAVVALVHPDTLLPAPADGGHPLLAYDTAALRHHLRALREAAARLGRGCRFETVSGFAARLADAPA